ncbi:MAG: glycosyltransferase family 4 protein [Nitrospinota bacterium]
MTAQSPSTALRMGFFEAEPHPVHRAFREAVEAEPICGWGMAWARGRSGLLSHLYTRGAAPLVRSQEARRFRGRFDVLITPSYGLRLAAWLKRYDPSMRLLYFNYCPFLDWVLKAPPMRQAYHRRALAAVDGVISGSALNAERASGLLGVPQRICHPFGGERTAELRPPDDARTVLVVGELHPVKRVHRALETFAALRRALGPSWRLVVVGDGTERAALERQAASMEGVTFTGFIPFDRLLSLYAEAFALLQLSAFDNFPVTVIEAAAAGVLPLVSDTVGSTETLPPVLVVKHGDPGEAAERLVALAKMPATQRKALRGQCRQAAAPFTRERQTARFRHAVYELLDAMDRSVPR